MVLYQQLSGMAFQYSFCSYSTLIWVETDGINASFNTASVLIQHKEKISYQMSFGSFNTASVLIQPDKVAIERKMNLFQYSFCSYSTSLCQGINCINHRFNTASVLIQPVHPSTSGNCYRVSIQLLFLFNYDRF